MKRFFDRIPHIDWKKALPWAILAGYLTVFGLFLMSVASMDPQEEREKPVETLSVDPRPLYDLPEPPPDASEEPEPVEWALSTEAKRCLAANIYYEARNQDLSGMLGVGLVTLNRVEDSRWADTVCGVVTEPWQFSWTRKGYPEYPDPQNEADAEALQEIELLVEFLATGGADHVDHVAQDAHFYHNPNMVDWQYADDYTLLGDVGDHRFYA